ncbi:MAG: PEP-CTERM sorting domain-containing protein, partial [Phycisphaerales bacterium JB039]
VFDIACSHRVIGGGWGSWSHGYTGDVYYTNGAASLTMSLPANTAFYFYAEPNPFALIEFEITDGTDTVVESINGSSGAKGYGFCDAKRVGVRTTDGVTDFAVGEFGIAN